MSPSHHFTTWKLLHASYIFRGDKNHPSTLIKRIYSRVNTVVLCNTGRVLHLIFTQVL